MSGNIVALSPHVPRRLLAQQSRMSNPEWGTFPAFFAKEREEFFFKLGDMCTGEKKWEICEKEVERLFGGRGVTMAWLVHVKEISEPLRKW